ncbi:hypothetical protein [Pseudoxanthomonas koreensis]|uniref:hypothetical protein n=1 Tax=Pseudoxanthomonas koreensis TaxID=266061 RepID=UPI001391E6DD|nr:hypothetical protein [Pseudoxanthomonas koreensis]
MDFLKILKSFEEFVYEALTWLVLLPRTLWRIVVSPRRMTGYAGTQLASQDESRFSDAISPPLLLILCVLISHFIDLAMRHPAPEENAGLGAVVLSSEQNLLLYRTIAFGVWSLAGAVYLLVRTRRPVDRETLRAPFYEQCYLVAPFAFTISVSLTLMALDRPWLVQIAACMFLAATGWFWLVQAAWFRSRASLGLWRSLLAAALVLVVGSVVNAGVGRVLSASGHASATAAEDPASP